MQSKAPNDNAEEPPRPHYTILIWEVIALSSRALG